MKISSVHTWYNIDLRVVHGLIGVYNRYQHNHDLCITRITRIHHDFLLSLIVALFLWTLHNSAWYCSILLYSKGRRPTSEQLST